MKKITFQVPTSIKDILDIPYDAETFWIYWEPAGDELMAGYLPGPTMPYISTEFTSNWSAWFKLRELNPHVMMGHHNLGSSDESATHAILFVERDRGIGLGKLNIYIITMEELETIRSKGIVNEPTERPNTVDEQKADTS